MTIFQVSTADGLMAALETAQGSDEIRVASGNYGDVTLSGFAFSSEVTITSADRGDPAVFSSVNVMGTSNVTFDGLAFDFVPDADTVEWDSALKVVSSSNITVRDSVFEGGDSIAGVLADSAPGTQGSHGILGEPIGRGVTFDRSSGITFENNEISGFTRGMVLNDVQDAVIAENEMHHLRTSPLGGTKLDNITVEANYFHSSQPWKYGGLGDHGDYIHFWIHPDQDAATDSISIKNNFFEEGDGTPLLGIYLEDNIGGSGYTNVEIEGNVIHAGNAQAIRLEDVNGGTVINNTLIQGSGAANDAPGIGLHDGVKNLTVANNIMSANISGDAAADAAALNIALTGNLIVQYTDPEGENYFGNLFVNSSLPGAALSDIRIVPGSAADGIGSPLTQLDETPAVVTPGFQVTSNGDIDGQSVVLDATPTYGPSGQVLADDAVFSWDFGDGTSATGRIVEHTYATSGHYAVTLSVVLDGQDVTTATVANAEVGITGDDIIAFNGSDGAFYLQGYGDEVVIDNSDAVSVATSQGMALDLGGVGTKVTIAKEDLSRFFGTDAFEMSMTLQADQPGASWGEVARIHNSIIVSVREGGELSVRLFPDTDEIIELKSSGVSVNDGAKHDISIQFDGASDSLQIVIDGQVAGSQTVTGSMPEMGSWGLIFGVPSWGEQNFDGKMSAFELDAPATDYPVFDGVLEETPEDPTVPVPETPRDTEEDQDEGSLPGPDDTDFVADFEQLRKGQLHDDAYVETTTDGSTTYLDGEKDYVRLGKMSQFEAAEQLSLSVTYSKDIQNTDEQRLVWNSKNVGLTVEGDSLKVLLGQTDERFHKAIRIDDLGIDDTDLHQVSVIVDSVSDHLQVVLDGALVLDQQQELDISFAGGIDNAWKIGGGRAGYLDGEIYDFRIDSSADFLPESALASDDASLMG